MAAVTRYRLRTDGGDPSDPLTLRAVIALLRKKLARHPAGRHYRVDGGPLRTRYEIRFRVRRHLKHTKLGDVVQVLVDLEHKHTYTIRRVSVNVPDGGMKVVDWMQQRIGTPYDSPGQVGNNATAMDCSGSVLSAVQDSTNGKVVLPHQTVTMWHDPRVIHIPLEKLKPGDLMFFHGSDPAHVATFWDRDADGIYWVLDEEPGTEVYNDKVIYGGLRPRPCAPGGYYLALSNLTGCGRIEAVNGPA